MGIKTTQNFTLIWNLLRKMKKLANKKVTGNRSVQNWSLYSSILITCTSFLEITFSRYSFFKLFPRIWNQHKILRFLYSYVKKEIKKFWGHGVHIWVFYGNSRMQIRKIWLNQLKNFLTNILKNIIWHLFAGESHQAVKITVPCCACIACNCRFLMLFTDI